jgi:hypothetical protein
MTCAYDFALNFDQCLRAAAEDQVLFFDVHPDGGKPYTEMLYAPTTSPEVARFWFRVLDECFTEEFERYLEARAFNEGADPERFEH